MLKPCKEKFDFLRSQVVILEALFVKTGRKFLRCQIGTLNRMRPMFNSRRDREDITDCDIIGEKQELVTSCDRLDIGIHSFVEEKNP